MMAPEPTDFEISATSPSSAALTAVPPPAAMSMPSLPPDLPEYPAMILPLTGVRNLRAPSSVLN